MIDRDDYIYHKIDDNLNQSIFIFEISLNSNEANYKRLTLREILNLINEDGNRYDRIKSISKLSSPIDISHRSHKILGSRGNDQHNLSRSNSNQSIKKKRPSLRNSFTSTNSSNDDDIETSFDLAIANNLRLRDLRRLDYNYYPIDEPSIVIRKHVVLMSFDPIRVLITAERILLIVPDGADSLLQILDSYMTDWKNNVDSIENMNSFELHAYEAILTTIISLHKQDCENLKRNIDNDLKYYKIGSIIPVEIQDRMRHYKNTLMTIMSAIIRQQKVLVELLEDDEIMAFMNLTLLKLNPLLYNPPLSDEFIRCHENIEDFIESNLIDYNSLLTKLQLLDVNIQSAEDLIQLKLNSSQNELLIITTSFSILLCCIGFSLYITGAFAMNLDNAAGYRFQAIQAMLGGFVMVTVISFVLIFLLYYTIIFVLIYNQILPFELIEKLFIINVLRLCFDRYITLAQRY